MRKIREIWPEIKFVSREIDEQLEISSHYKGYLKKQKQIYWHLRETKI